MTAACRRTSQPPARGPLKQARIPSCALQCNHPRRPPVAQRLGEDLQQHALVVAVHEDAQLLHRGILLRSQRVALCGAGAGRAAGRGRGSARGPACGCQGGTACAPAGGPARGRGAENACGGREPKRQGAASSPRAHQPLPRWHTSALRAAHDLVGQAPVVCVPRPRHELKAAGLRHTAHRAQRGDDVVRLERQVLQPRALVLLQVGLRRGRGRRRLRSGGAVC